MKEVKKLGRQTIVYGFGGVISKTSAFILLPLYTNHLTLEEYGTLELLYMTSSICTLLLGRQIAHATLRFYYEYDDLSEKNSVISTSFISYTLVASCILILLSLNSGSINNYLFPNENYLYHFQIIFIGLYFNLSKEIFLSYMRALEKAFLYVFVSIAELLLKIGACICLVVYFDMGVLGVLIGNLCGDVIAWLILFIVTFINCGSKYDPRKIGEIFKYAFPLMLVGVSGTIMSNADRFLLKSYTTIETVGLYGLGMRFATILRFLIINPFTRAYGPFRFSIMKQDNAQIIYARVATYFIFICVWACLGITALSSEIIILMADKAFWDASSVVPILLISVFSGSGLYYVFQTGIYIQKSTKILSYVFFSAVIAELGLMIFLIPQYGMIGAATSKAVVHVYIAVLGLYFSNRVYRIQYNWRELFTIMIIGVVLGALTFFSYSSEVSHSLLIKIPIVLSFPFIVLLFGVFNENERKQTIKFLLDGKNWVLNRGAR